MKMLPAAAMLFTAFALATAAQAHGPIARGQGDAPDIMTMNNGDSVYLPDCRDHRGIKVRFAVTNAYEYTQNAGAQDYGARYSIESTASPQTGPQVRMSPGILNLPTSSVQFAVEHECYHHQSGDVFQSFMDSVVPGRYPESYSRLELDADCAAAQRMRDKFGYNADDIREALAIYPEKTPNHPPRADRVARALACFSELIPSAANPAAAPR